MDEDKWIPIAEVLAVFDREYRSTSRNHKYKWDWIRNPSCKYIDLRIDTRDMCCVIFDRDGKLITLDELRQQYASEEINVEDVNGNSDNSANSGNDTDHV